MSYCRSIIIAAFIMYAPLSSSAELIEANKAKIEENKAKIEQILADLDAQAGSWRQSCHGGSFNERTCPCDFCKEIKTAWEKIARLEEVRNTSPVPWYTEYEISANAKKRIAQALSKMNKIRQERDALLPLLPLLPGVVIGGLYYFGYF